MPKSPNSTADADFSIRIVGNQNRGLVLTVFGYMLPFKTDNYFESNWIKADIVLTDFEGKTKKIHLKTLQVEELVNLENWLGSLLNDLPRSEETFDFIDPSFIFRVKEIEGKVSLTFEYSMRSKNWVWRLDLTPDVIINFRNQVKLLLAKFPLR